MDEKLLNELMEPITDNNINELKLGEWIWDNKMAKKLGHGRECAPRITEPIGFRQVHVLDLDCYKRYSNRPFMLSNVEYDGYVWVYFEDNRFYKFKDRSLFIKTEYEPKVIAVDFDGTLCEENWPGIGAPKTQMIEYLKERKTQGDKLILWTCRVDERLDEAVDWCLDHGLIFDAVNDNLPELVAKYGDNSRKVFADEYIDDRTNSAIWRRYRHE